MATLGNGQEVIVLGGAVVRGGLRVTVSKSPVSCARDEMMLTKLTQAGECVVKDDRAAGQDEQDGECCLLSSAGVSVATCP